MNSYYETIPVEQLFQEELDALREQYDILIGKGTDNSLRAAEDLEHVIRYFEARLGQIPEQERVPGPDDTLH